MRYALVLGSLMLGGCVGCWASGGTSYHRHDKDLVAGPQGPIGLQGPKGESGDAALDATRLNIGAEIEWADWEHAALSSGYRYDLHHHGHTVDLGVIKVKLGKSYMDREMVALKQELEAQNRILARLSSQKGAEVKEIVIKGAK